MKSCSLFNPTCYFNRVFNHVECLKNYNIKENITNLMEFPLRKINQFLELIVNNQIHGICETIRSR